MLLSAEVQDKLAAGDLLAADQQGPPSRRRHAANVTVHNLDWEFVAKNRGDWVKRWDRDMAM